MESPHKRFAMFATEKEVSHTAIDPIEADKITMLPLFNNALSKDVDATSDKSHTLSSSTVKKV